MSQTAFALREEFQGTVEVPADDGTTTEVPVFEGGVLALPGGNGEIDIREELARNGGVIVLDHADLGLIEILRRYPPLKETTEIPEGAVAFGAYESRPKSALNEEAERRGFESFKRLNKDKLAAALKAHDEATRSGDSERAAAIAADPSSALELDPEEGDN